MARSVFTPQEILRTGLTPAYGAVDTVNGNEFANNGAAYMHVKNGGASPTNATIQTPGLVDGLAVADLVVTIGAGAEKIIGPFPPGVYNQANGKVYVDFSVGTSVTAGIFVLRP